MRGIRRGLLLLATGIVWTGTAHAQAAAAPGGGAGAELRRNLTVLAQNPRSVIALNGAGRAALEMGDADAALSFFARAADAEPGNARAKAGMASALVRLERAGDAMPLFAQAISLGAPEVEIAADRGLAWDSLGQPARAQADYALSLRREDDPEVRRRLALSLAISGRREEALRVIEDQLRDRDRAAWRTQAFILALTGDSAGAGQTARDMMPSGADALAPFLARLSALSPSQKALAVHFGHFPSNGRAESFAQADAGPDPGALALAQGSQPMGGVRARSRPEYSASAFRAAPRRRPGAAEDSVASQIRPAPRDPAFAQPRRPVQIAELQPRRVQSQPQGQAPPWPEPVLDERQRGESRPEPRRQAPAPAPAWAEPVLDEQSSPGFTLVPQGRPLGTRAEPRPAPSRSQPTEPASDFSSVTAFVNSLPRDEAGEIAPPVRIAPAIPSRTRTANTRPAPATTRASRARSPAQVHPSRVWVQMAIGNNRAALVYQYGAFRRQAPALLGSRAAYSTEWNATNRLLVGPFASESAARAFAAQLGARGVQAHSWTSEAGQEIDTLQGANDSRTTRTRTAAAEQRPAAGSRTARSRAGQQRPTAAGATRSGRSASTRAQSGRSQSGRAPSARAQSGAKPKPAAAGASRGRSQPQSRPAARGRRSR